MKKRALAVFMALCVVISCLSGTISAYATTRTIQQYQVDKESILSNELDGEGDMIWYIYTPEISGTYSFLSYNVHASEAYLFVKEKDPDTGKKIYTQLEFSNESSNWEENGQSGILQFCLTYYLEAGVTYYFAAGWSKNPNETTMNVMLRCDAYGEKVIDSIDVSCPATLSAYIDGQWQKDTNGVSYFYYNLSRIMANITITIHYNDGSTSTVIGKDEIDGYDILFTHTQSVNHWYAQSTPEYTANTLTIKIADASVDFDVPIEISSMYAVKGTVVDTDGNPVANARIVNSNSNSTLATTDANGKYYFASLTGKYNITVRCDHAVSRNVEMMVGTGQSGNSFEPIQIVTCDYVDDEIINAKDYAYIVRNLSGSELDEKKEQFSNYINFSQDDYEPVTLVSSTQQIS